MQLFSSNLTEFGLIVGGKNGLDLFIHLLILLGEKKKLLRRFLYLDFYNVSLFCVQELDFRVFSLSECVTISLNCFPVCLHFVFVHVYKHIKEKSNCS